MYIDGNAFSVWQLLDKKAFSTLQNCTEMEELTFIRAWKPCCFIMQGLKSCKIKVQARLKKCMI